MTPEAQDAQDPARSRGTVLDGALLAVGTLTAIRVPPPRRVDQRSAGLAMVLAPVVGLVPGGLGAGVAWAALGAGGGALLAAALAVATLALTTRGLHLDGLADTADGLASGYDRDRALAVMRRGDTGPAGVATVVLVLLAQVAALAQAFGPAGPVAVVVAAVAGRAVLPLACLRGVPAARGDGLGATVAGSVPRSLAAVALAASTGLAAAALAGSHLLADLNGGTGARGSGWSAALGLAAVAVAGAVVSSVVLLTRSVRRLGGVTGDVLGACVEVATLAALVVLALTAGVLQPLR